VVRHDKLRRAPLLAYSVQGCACNARCNTQNVTKTGELKFMTLVVPRKTVELL